MSDSGYLLAGQASELERLQLQSRVWEPAGRALLSQLGSGDGLSALDVGCGCFGWLRILSAWVGPRGSVTGTDVDDQLLEAARALIREESLSNVSLEPRLLRLVSRNELEELRRLAEAEIAQPGRWGTTFTVIQTWATVRPGS